MLERYQREIVVRLGTSALRSTNAERWLDQWRPERQHRAGSVHHRNRPPSGAGRRPVRGLEPGRLRLLSQRCSTWGEFGWYDPPQMQSRGLT